MKDTSLTSKRLWNEQWFQFIHIWIDRDQPVSVLGWSVESTLVQGANLKCVRQHPGWQTEDRIGAGATDDPECRGNLYEVDERSHSGWNHRRSSSKNDTSKQWILWTVSKEGLLHVKQLWVKKWTEFLLSWSVVKFDDKPLNKDWCSVFATANQTDRETRCWNMEWVWTFTWQVYLYLVINVLLRWMWVKYGLINRLASMVLHLAMNSNFIVVFNVFFFFCINIETVSRNTSLVFASHRKSHWNWIEMKRHKTLEFKMSWLAQCQVMWRAPSQAPFFFCRVRRYQLWRLTYHTMSTPCTCFLSLICIEVWLVCVCVAWREIARSTWKTIGWGRGTGAR